MSHAFLYSPILLNNNERYFNLVIQWNMHYELMQFRVLVNKSNFVWSWIRYPTTLYDGNYVFVNIQKWIFIFSADELVPRFISFNDFQWILTENLYEKDKFSNILNFFSQRIIETGCQFSMSHVTSRDTTHVTPRYKTKYNRIISPDRRSPTVGGTHYWWRTLPGREPCPRGNFIMPNYPLVS